MAYKHKFRFEPVIWKTKFSTLAPYVLYTVCKLQQIGKLPALEEHIFIWNSWSDIIFTFWVGNGKNNRIQQLVRRLQVKSVSNFIFVMSSVLRIFIHCFLCAVEPPAFECFDLARCCWLSITECAHIVHPM